MRDVDAARRAGDPTTMHKLLRELASLDKELSDLDAATRAARAAGVKPGTSSAPNGARPAASTPRPPPRPAEDPLAKLKEQAAAANRKSSASVDDELAALKRKMTETSKKK
jgi:hypothetical protein